MEKRKIRLFSESEKVIDASLKKQSRSQRSLESSFEHDDNKDENEFTLRNSLDAINSRNVTSDESGIDLESPCPSKALPIHSFNNSDDNHEVECSAGSDNETSDIENIAHSTPQTKKTEGSIKLKTPFNIFKIDLEKVDEAIDKKDASKILGAKTNADRIDFMIEQANPSLKRKRGQQTSPKLDPSRAYVPLSYKAYFNSSSKFKLSFYQKYTYSTNVESKEKIKKIHQIRFLHRADPEAEEIFALPSGSGSSAVIKWADTNFPLSVASATLDGKSVTAKEVKNLYENRYLTRLKMKTGESLTTTPEFHLRFAPQIYTMFHANINDDNEDLKKILGHDKTSKVKMQVRLESILFPGGVNDINTYAELCGKLSAIYTNPNLPRSREFDGYMSKVPKNRKGELDCLLRKELEKFFRISSIQQHGDVFGKLKHFYITQKDSTKYIEASNYLIYYNKKLVKTFNERPQLQDMYSIVQKNSLTSTLDNFIKSFENLKISTTPQLDKKCVKENLFSCLEGVFYDEGARKNYWRVSSEWYQVSGKYSFEVYAEYIRVLKTSLLRKCDCSLKYLWPLKEEREIPEKENVNKKVYEFSLKHYRQNRFVLEGDYNKLYTDQPTFIVTDAIVAPHGVELCDLFQHISNPKDKSTIHLHHVKKVFGAGEYRDAICQILCSARYLYDSFQKGYSEDTAAYKLFTFIKDNEKGTMAIYANYEEFLEQLRNATFVFSPLFESGDRELDKDYMALLKYDFSDFEDDIDEQYREDLKKELKSFLLDSGYIHQDGVFTQKWFDACSVVNDNGFHTKNDRGFYYDPFPGKGMGKLYQKKLRRILKNKYYKTVDGLSVKQLIVQMSEDLNFMGFGFKICQIEGMGDDRLCKD